MYPLGPCYLKLKMMHSMSEFIMENTHTRILLLIVPNERNGFCGLKISLLSQFFDDRGMTDLHYHKENKQNKNNSTTELQADNAM